ncbi:MAG: DUF502 domain-containing protein, partial [Dehalococcoidales bacterium]
AIWVLWWTFNKIDAILEPLISTVWVNPPPGLGFAIIMVLIMLTGFAASNVIGKKLLHYIELGIPFMPVFRWFYTGIKQIVESFTAPSGLSQMKPVLTEFPRKGMKVIGFITNELTQEPNKKIYSVFIPTSPNPTSGYLQIVDEGEITPIDISVDSALKMIISAGRVVPEELLKNLAGEEPSGS